MSKRIVVITAVLLAAGIGGYGTFRAAISDALWISSRDHAVWTEIPWPFPVDLWGGGWAFRCRPADCGIDVNLYLRPKIGFCNCQTGVADDEELDRVGDLDIIGSERSALGPGWPIAVHKMKGRGRSYKVSAPSAKSVLSVAFNSRCDVTVATVVTEGDLFAQEEAVLEFLNSDLVVHRVERVLGL